MPQNVQDPNRINASPTKEFFIYMLTRDIPLSRAILDLVDNSVDGARRLHPSEDFAGLWVRIELDRTHFIITDNCGGIPVDVARNYAFRFGRPFDAPPTPGSVGQFGVGMKRTFFKLGNRFMVRSVTRNSRFSMDIDVKAWKSRGDQQSPDDWHFQFSSVEENLDSVPEEEIGTRIEIMELHGNVADSFGLDVFVNRLKQELSVAHSRSMDKGLVVSVNGIPLRFEPQELFVSEDMQPAFLERHVLRELIDGSPGPGVNVKLYAGIAQRSLHDGGWYIFCNGRLVLRADQTALTVWGDTHSMRQYHPDFAYFRGYAYFDSENSALLPWTTTKTGVDVDSPVYRAIQQDMIEISKPILTFLSNLAKEKAVTDSGDSNDRTLAIAVETAKVTRTEQLSLTPVFVCPQPKPVPPGPRMQKIQYSKPSDEVTKAMTLLKVKTYTAVGERTFEYFMKYEGGNDDA